jgi:predicted nucleotidyltransferase component of viral defense system
MAPQNKQQARHENFMYRLLIEMLDDKYLAVNSFFKGGTCAKMLGFLDRFSVDLDFDLSEKIDKKKARKILHKIFDDLDFEIKDESKNALQFFLKYPALEGQRNTLKLEMLDKHFKSNKYEAQYLSPIERTAKCQTIETMFGNKLVALMERYENFGSIAGRDLYDIHHYFLKGYEYNKNIIEERRKESVIEYLKKLKKFIENKVTKKTIEEDLNTLLEYEKFNKIKKYLKRETINFLDKDIESLQL